MNLSLFKWKSKKREEEALKTKQMELQRILDDHKIWRERKCKSDGKADIEGQEYNGIVLKDKTDLTEVGLIRTKLRGANLSGVILINQNLKGTDLRDTDLTDADLTGVTNLLPEQLSGANLTRAKLPVDILKFEGVKIVEELSKNAGKMFTSMISTGIFFMIILQKTSDAQIFNNTISIKVPLVDVEIPLNNLYWIGPVVLFTLYIACHMYLQRLWEAMADLPAFFPDGMAVTRKTYPWLLNDLVSSGFPQLKKRSQPQSWVQNLLFTTLAYFLTPFFIVCFWARFLMKHDWYVTGWHITFVTIFTWSLYLYFALAKDTLSRKDERLDLRRGVKKWESKIIRQKTAIIALPLFFMAMVALIINSISYSAFNGVPSERYVDWENYKDLTPVCSTNNRYRLIPRLLSYLDNSPFAQLENAEFTKKPAAWNALIEEEMDDIQNYPYYPWHFAKDNKSNQSKDKQKKFDDDLAKWNGMLADLTPPVYKSMDLRYANAEGAFMVKVDMRGANLMHINLKHAHLQNAELNSSDLYNSNLEGAHLAGANLSGANLEGANLEWAYLMVAHLRKVHLRKARMKGAHLEGANLRVADLREAELKGAYLGWAYLEEAHLEEAHLEEADLREANLEWARLEGAHLRKADLRGAHLEWVHLRGVDLRGADLRGANGLSQSEIDSAYTDANTKVSRPWKIHPRKFYGRED